MSERIQLGRDVLPELRERERATRAVDLAFGALTWACLAGIAVLLVMAMRQQW